MYCPSNTLTGNGPYRFTANVVVKAQNLSSDPAWRVFASQFIAGPNSRLSAQKPNITISLQDRVSTAEAAIDMGISVLADNDLFNGAHANTYESFT